MSRFRLLKDYRGYKAGTELRKGAWGLYHLCSEKDPWGEVFNIREIISNTEMFEEIKEEPAIPDADGFYPGPR